MRGCAVVLALAGALPARAQRGKGTAPNGPEFTRQGLLVVNFTPGPGTSMKTGRKAADAVRSRVFHLTNHDQLDVIDGWDVTQRVQRAGYDPDTVFTMEEIRGVARFLRADEYVSATVTTVSTPPRGVRIDGDLLLIRNPHLRQPLPTATGPDLDSAASAFAHAIVAARVQIYPERRCENALRDGSGSRAIAAAREGVSAYPRAAFARACMTWAMRQIGTVRPAEILSVAQQLVAIDSTSYDGIEAAAVSLDSLHRRDDAATMWLRFAALDTTDVDQGLRAAYALADDGNTPRDEPFVAALAARFPDDLRVAELEWRVAYENKSWARARTVGETLLARDVPAQTDSTFYLRLGIVYHQLALPYQAVETLAHGVSHFPKDESLYALYAQYVRAEADTVIPRGLALFPRSADLLALDAKDLRAKGKLAEAADATKRAVALDSTIKQGHLMVADLEVELGHPDSALAELHFALSAGEDSSLVAQFALAKGNTYYRAANGTKTSDDFQLALRYLAFADSVRTSQQSRFLMGAAALGVAQAAVTEMPKLKDKTESCRRAQLAADMIPMARTGLQAGQDLYADAAKQSLDFLDQQLDPYVGQQVTALCGVSPGSGITP